MIDLFGILDFLIIFTSTATTIVVFLRYRKGTIEKRELFFAIFCIWFLVIIAVRAG